MSNIQLAMEQAGLEIVDVEGLRPHCALTLRRWVSWLEANREAAVAEVGETAYHVRRLYMAGCALEFESVKAAARASIRFLRHVPIVGHGRRR